MENQPLVDRPTIRAHKAQFLWQILMPMLLITMIFVVAGAFVIANAVSTGGQTRLWADISLIWVLAPALLFALVCLVIVITTIYGMVKVLQLLPHYTGKTQEFFSLFTAGTRKLADGATRPIVWFRQAGAVIKSIFRMK
jgi:hypothetical protein